ncbi:hypothetical protein LINGRAHAP2_LOCUS34029 [Linum grandiflorum]
MDQFYKIATTTTTTTLLLLLTTIVAAALVDKQGYSNPGPEPQGCSKEGPLDSGPCKGGYYPYCVTEAMKMLIAEAPTDSEGYGKSESYPAGNPSGGAYDYIAEDVDGLKDSTVVYEASPKVGQEVTQFEPPIEPVRTKHYRLCVVGSVITTRPYNFITMKNKMARVWKRRRKDLQAPDTRAMQEIESSVESPTKMQKGI